VWHISSEPSNNRLTLFLHWGLSIFGLSILFSCLVLSISTVAFFRGANPPTHTDYMVTGEWVCEAYGPLFPQAKQHVPVFNAAVNRGCALEDHARLGSVHARRDRHDEMATDVLLTGKLCRPNRIPSSIAAVTKIVPQMCYRLTLLLQFSC